MQSQQKSSSNLKLLGIIALFYAAIAGINYLILGKEQLCLWRAICGYPCPGCGLTHAGLFLLTGNICESLIWNPFLVPYVFLIGTSCIPYGKFRFVDYIRKNEYFFLLLNISFISYFIYRLIRFYPQDPSEGPMFYDPHNYLHLIQELLS